MLGADPSQSGPRFIILSGDSRFHLTLRGRAHYGICDFFCVQTLLFDTLHVFFVIQHINREVLHVAVTRHPTAEWLAQQIIESCAWDRRPPRFMIHDRDSRYGPSFDRRLKRLKRFPTDLNRGDSQRNVDERVFAH